MDLGDVYLPGTTPMINDIVFPRVLCRRRFDYVNHARRLATDDWSKTDQDETDGKDEEEDDVQEREEMEVELKRCKLPRYYANQVGV